MKRLLLTLIGLIVHNYSVDSASVPGCPDGWCLIEYNNRPTVYSLPTLYKKKPKMHRQTNTFSKFPDSYCAFVHVILNSLLSPYLSMVNMRLSLQLIIIKGV